MNKLDSMQVFVRVVERGSFSLVADEMRISGTMVGLHIKSLEAYLGTRLLNRTTRRQSLTDFGANYYERCRRILADIDEAESIAQALQQNPRGKLKIACPVSFGVHALSLVNAQYLAQFPDVTIDLVLSDKAIDMAEEGVDVMIKIGELDNVNSLVARSLAPYRSVICASPDYLERKGLPVHHDQLIHHDCLGFAHPVASHYWYLQKGKTQVKVPVNLVMSINHGEALRTAAVQGAGIIMQPEVLLADDIHHGRLRVILSDYEAPQKSVNVLTFYDRQQLPKIKCYVNYLVQHFKKTLTVSLRQ